MFKKMIALLGAAMFVVSISACNWFVAQPKYNANEKKPASEQPVVNSSDVQKID